MRNDRCTTKNHTAYRTFSPVSTWKGNSTRPRVMTYVSLRSKLNADQLKPTPSRDILLIRAGGISFLNIYRQPGTLETLNFLDRWEVPSRCLIAGDFNASHTLWQAGPHRNQGARIASWIDSNNLAILNQPNQPTNKYNNILDLAISNIPTAQARVKDYLATSSDHYTLSIILPIARPTPPQSSRIRISDPKDLARLAEVVSLGQDFLTTTATTAEELDIAAAQLLDLLQDAIRIVGRCPQQNGRSAPWWTKDCAKAHAQYQAAKRRDPRELGPAILAKEDFRKIVKKAKTDFWRDIINNATTNADIFRIAGWVRTQSAFQPPPLQVGDEVFVTQEEKANALRKATLERLDAGDDIEDPWTPLAIEAPELPFSTQVSAEEAEDINAPPCPGFDPITTIRYGYADDIASIHIGKTLRDTTDEAEVNMEEIEYWGACNEVSFDPGKTEIMHFSRRQSDSSPTIDHKGQTKAPEKALRWLGVWLDRKLSFKAHVEEWVIKAQATANLLRGLANTVRGPPPDKVRLAVKACVLPILFYGAEAWYPGKRAPSLRAGGPLVSTRIDHLLDRLKKVLHTSIRSILPTWKTTPLAALYRESGIPPVEQLLEAIRLRHAARLQSLDPRHPLTARTVIPTPGPSQKPIYKTRLQRTALLLPPSSRPDLLQRKYSSAQLHIQPKDIAVPAFLTWIETLSAIDLVYSDGSRSSGGAAGYGAGGKTTPQTHINPIS
ncbi:reverse transcriptase domain protein [Ilyonectria robusta]